MTRLLGHGYEKKIDGKTRRSEKNVCRWIYALYVHGHSREFTTEMALIGYYYKMTTLLGYQPASVIAYSSVQYSNRVSLTEGM